MESEGKGSCATLCFTPSLINASEWFFDIEGRVALDRNLGPGNNTILLRLIPGDIYSSCHHRQFHTLTGLYKQLHCHTHTFTLASQASR